MIFFAGWPSDAAAQEQASDGVHWAFSAYFGTGWYSVSGDRDVFVFRVTPEWELAEPSFEAGERNFGWYLKTPVVTGLDRFDVDEVVEAVDLDNVTFLSVNPGIDVEIPVNDVWSLRPYASLGYGSALNGGESAWSYWAGIKSRVLIHGGTASTWHLVNNVGYVGYTPNAGPSDKFWPAMAGLEVSHAVRRKGAGRTTPWLLHWNAGYTYFGDDILFSRSPGSSRDIVDQWEVCVALGRRDEPVKIWFVSFDRLGIGYRASSNGDLSGITFIFRSAFER